MKSPINLNLEALRGYAALFVIIGHLEALHSAFHQDFTPSLLIVFAPSSHLFLLVFFVLSGYVITSNNKGINNFTETITYTRKRFLRIYPIYFLALFITLCIAAFQYPLSNVLWNFAMLQDLMAPPFAENGPAWSLHFEMLFYLLFIPLVFFRLNFSVVLIVAVVLALANYGFYPNPHTPILSSYLLGFSFWIGGACIAKYLPVSKLPTASNKLLSILFFTLAIDQMVLKSGLPELVNKAAYFAFNQHLEYPPGVDQSKINLSYKDLAFLPYCIFAVTIFSGRRLKHQTLCFLILLLPLIYSIYIALTEARHAHAMSFAVPVLYFCISVVVWFLNAPLLSVLGRLTIKFGAWLGGISYGLYIIHAPLIFFVGKFSFSDNRFVSYGFKLVLFLILVASSAYLLEKVYQPWIRGLLEKRKPVGEVKV